MKHRVVEAAVMTEPASLSDRHVIVWSTKGKEMALQRASRGVMCVVVGIAVFAAVGAQVCLTIVAAQSTAVVTWANTGEDKVTRDELRVTRGGMNVTNSVWDGQTIHLFGARNEVVNFNVILEAPNGASNVSVSFNSLTGPSGVTISSQPAVGDGVFDYVGRNIELFFVRYLQIKGLSRVSYGTYDERHVPTMLQRPWSGQGFGSGGWSNRPNHDKYYPEIAVPMELTPTFSIPSASNQSIWTDVYVPPTAAAGSYTGQFVVQIGSNVIQTIPVQMHVYDFALPDEPSAKTMLFISSPDIHERYFADRWLGANSPNAAQAQLVRDRHFLLAHRHRISLIGDDPGNLCPSAVDQPCPEWAPRLNGSLFTAANGYDGPGVGTGNNVYSVGTYGGWSWQNQGQAGMNQHTDNWENWFSTHAISTERFLYLIDESSNYPQIQAWSSWIRQNPGPGHNLRSMATIALPDAAAQTPALDIPTSTISVGVPSQWQPLADRYTSDARQRFYMYNAHRPASGSSATEDDGVAMRELAWGQYKQHISRWFMWEGTYYYDYQSGRGQTNVFQNAQTFGGDSGFDPVIGETGWNYANGDGVFFYPGTERLFPGDSYGVMGPLASLRLKFWRRGIQDVDYLTLAAAVNPAAVQSIVNTTVPKVLWEYGVSDPNDPTWVRAAISWSSNPDVWESARKQLADIIAGSTTTPVTASLTANPTSIINGQAATLTWSSTNASACTGTNFSTGDAVSGSVAVSPTVTATYGLTCSGTNGSASANTIITVSPGSAPTASLAANPSAIANGQASTLTWSSTNAASCTGTNFSTGNATAGSTSVSPAATTTYSVSCTGPGGTVAASATVTVNAVAGLRGSWQFDEGSGTTTADSSGFGNTGTFSGTPPTWTTGVTGPALSFAGTGGFVNFPASASLNDLEAQGPGGMSIVVWIYPTNLSGNQTILSKGTWGLGLNGGGTFGFGESCTSGQVGSFSAANAVPLNQWSQLAVTWDGSTTSSAVVLYVNGAAIYAYPQGCSGSIVSDAAYALTLGATYYNANSVVGKIDGARVYNRVLAPAEIAGLYNGTPRASLVANPTSISGGQTSTLTWSSANTGSCIGTGFSTGNATAGSSSVSPAATTTYSISCTGAGGSASASATVTVNTITGLRGHWQLDEGSGTTAADASGYGNTGTLSETPLPTWTTGVTGNALSFGGSGGYLNVPGSASMNNLQLQGSGGLSMVAWIYPTSVSGNQTILNKGTWGFGLTGNGSFGFGDSCTSGQVGSYSPANVVPVNQWTQIAVTWNGTTSASATILYVNGAQISAYPQGCSGSLSSDSAYALTVGATYYNANSTVGKIDNVRIYNRVLSPSEVSTLYNIK